MLDYLTKLNEEVKKIDKGLNVNFWRFRIQKKEKTYDLNQIEKYLQPETDTKKEVNEVK